MGDQTQISPDALRDTAKKIGDIMNADVMKAFEDLPDTPPDAGHFDTATWLQGRVADRVTGLKSQGWMMKSAFEEVCAGLTKVAKDLESTDRNNAGALKQDVQDIRNTIQNEVSGTGPHQDAPAEASPRQEIQTVKDDQPEDVQDA